MPHLPPDLPVPRLLDVNDDGEWVAVVFEDVEGKSEELRLTSTSPQGKALLNDPAKGDFLHDRWQGAVGRVV